MRSLAENDSMLAVFMIHLLGYQEHHGEINFPSADRKHTGKESSLDHGQKGCCLPQSITAVSESVPSPHPPQSSSDSLKFGQVHLGLFQVN